MVSNSGNNVKGCTSVNLMVLQCDQVLFSKFVLSVEPPKKQSTKRIQEDG